MDNIDLNENFLNATLNEQTQKTLQISVLF